MKFIKMHCLECGETLETINYTQDCTKYRCNKCDLHWFKSTVKIVEWSKEKIIPNA
jgi:transposase-like protein